MSYLDELAQHRPDRGTVLTIGVFDGVHTGHRHLIGRAVERASERGLLSGVVTFHPIPRTVLQPGFTVPLLSLLPERVELIKSLGVDIVAPLTFTHDLSRVGAADFIALLQEHLRLEGLVIGPDFALGRGREGNVEALQALGAARGFPVEVVELIESGNERISSTNIRNAVLAGDVARAGAMLGRPFTVQGEVVHGDARGRTLGFPTANIVPVPERALPADGIYATLTALGGREFPSATYIGTRPTFGSGDRLIEVFLLDFDGDIYGQDVTITMADRVRGDRQFENGEELAMQMQRDVEETRRILSAFR
ncbi:MAG: bifunctional riboflavin kinase/FAD synthetase [Chloroflexi bacterium]|nr:bifunctional riboflavin kinase/FAD synthetase [Chloroflexota bacterium]